MATSAVPRPSTSFGAGITITGPVTALYREMLTPGACRFLADLARRFEGRRCDVLHGRTIRQDELDHGWLPDFPEETTWVRESSWTVAALPCALRDRRVEISGPVDRHSVLSAMNSGACLFMADFEDGNAPTWDNLLQGQVNLRDAIDGTLSCAGPDGQVHDLADQTATLAVRPRGWHLVEHHVLVDGRPIPATLFDIGLFLYHSGQSLLEDGSAPYLYLPKVESYFEARLWNDVLGFIERDLALPLGTIKVTVIIESVLAAFHMDEILYELRERAVGLRLGKWDYAFNYLKRLHRNGATLWPDREHLDGPQPFLEAVARLMVQTCRRRGAHAIGGKINHDPRTTDRQRKDRLFEQVLDNLRADVSAGCNGTQVAHPGLVPIAVGVFDASGNGDNGGSEAPLVPVTREDLLTPPTGPITESGLRENIHLVVRYLAHWMNGRGSVELADRVSNAANAEFARALTWHWIRRSATLEDGRAVTPDLVRATIQAELDDVEEQIGELGTMALRYNRAADLAERLLVADRLDEFMTTVAYAELS